MCVYIIQNPKHILGENLTHTNSFITHLEHEVLLKDRCASETKNKNKKNA